MTALMGLDTRLHLAKLYLVTDLRGSMARFSELAEAAFLGGVDILQVRQKGLDFDTELEALEIARDLAQRTQALVAVNDQPDLAKQFNADVLHLGQDDDPPRLGRTFLHQWGLIGQSTHDEAQARAAMDDPEVNYFCVGPVFRTQTKPDYSPVGLELVEYASALAPPADPHTKPWFAIGGINPGVLDRVLEAGARRVVVSRAITEADDPEAAATELSDRLTACWNADPGMDAVVAAAFGLTTGTAE